MGSVLAMASERARWRCQSSWMSTRGLDAKGAGGGVRRVEDGEEQLGSLGWKGQAEDEPTGMGGLCSPGLDMCL